MRRERALAEITLPDVQAVYNDMKARGLTTRTIQYTHSVLTSALKQAVGWQLIQLNPAGYTRRPKAEADELGEAGAEKMRVLDADGAERFIRAAPSDAMGAALIFALATGARPEEYLALRWSDVDFDRGEVLISRVVQWHRKAEGGGFYFLPPKTRKSRRTLRVSESVLKVLKGHRRAQVRQRLKRGARYQPLDSSSLRARARPSSVTTCAGGTWFRCLRRRSLTLPHLHCLRHTFATLALAGASTRKRSP